MAILRIFAAIRIGGLAVFQPRQVGRKKAQKSEGGRRLQGAHPPSPSLRRGKPAFALRASAFAFGFRLRLRRDKTARQRNTTGRAVGLA